MAMPCVQKVKTTAMLVLCILAFSAAAKEPTVRVLTELPPLYSITATLAQDTSITVSNVPAAGRRMNALARTLEKPDDAMLDSFKKADAVVTTGKLWRAAPLYAAVRGQNIRVVNIDATEPYSDTLPGIALAREPGAGPPWNSADRFVTGDRPSLYFWLSIANGVRMAEIIAHDLALLSPADASQIRRNLAQFRRQLLDLKAEYEEKFARLDELTVFALATDFAYLTADMGLFVDGYFSKQDIEWSAEDLKAFSSYLRERRIRIVIHKWEPSAAIQQAIREGGAVLKVLRTAEDGSVRDGVLSRDGYLEDLRFNLEAIATS
jgi:ABC-type Zn uptake system ZnuABC Zn-binding protein ZnuA